MSNFIGLPNRLLVVQLLVLTLLITFLAGTVSKKAAIPSQEVPGEQGGSGSLLSEHIVAFFRIPHRTQPPVEIQRYSYLCLLSFFLFFYVNCYISLFLPALPGKEMLYTKRDSVMINPEQGMEL